MEKCSFLGEALFYQRGSLVPQVHTISVNLCRSLWC